VLNAAAAPPSPAVSLGVTGGRLIRRVQPVYPPTARALHLHGTVVLKAGVDVHGRVTRVTVLSGNELLAGAAMSAVRNWRYEPFLVNGVPVANEVVVKVTFVKQ
jgi:protein TonB